MGRYWASVARDSLSQGGVSVWPLSRTYSRAMG